MHTSTQKHNRLSTSDPPILLAILIAARRTGDRLLEDHIKRELQEKHCVRISFVREASDAS